MNNKTIEVGQYRIWLPLSRHRHRPEIFKVVAYSGQDVSIEWLNDSDMGRYSTHRQSSYNIRQYSIPISRLATVVLYGKSLPK